MGIPPSSLMPSLYALRQRQVVPVAWSQVAPGLRDSDDGAVRLQLREPIAQSWCIAPHIEHSCRGGWIVEPAARTQAQLALSIFGSRHGSLQE